MIGVDRRVFETEEEAVATWSSLNMHLLSSKAPPHFAIEVRVYPLRHVCGMGGGGSETGADIIDAEATICVLDRAYIDLTSPIGRGFMAFISAMAEDERQPSSSARTKVAAIARENGVKMGRKFRVNDAQRAEARRRLTNGEAASHLARVYGVSRATIYRV